jgi:hypothetical protein
MKNIIFILLLLYLNFVNGQTNWKTINLQSGITIELPEYFSKGILVAGGTLQWFNNTIDDDIQLSVESFGNGTIKDLQESYKSDLENEDNITYKIKKDTWYVISGKNENGIFYNKSIIKNGIQFHLRIIYQEKNKHIVETLLGKISSSFKAI